MNNCSNANLQIYRKNYKSENVIIPKTSPTRIDGACEQARINRNNHILEKPKL